MQHRVSISSELPGGLIIRPSKLPRARLILFVVVVVIAIVVSGIDNVFESLKLRVYKSILNCFSIYCVLILGCV